LSIQLERRAGQLFQFLGTGSGLAQRPGVPGLASGAL